MQWQKIQHIADDIDDTSLFANHRECMLLDEFLCLVVEVGTDLGDSFR
jgi:hypothetical protein